MYCDDAEILTRSHLNSPPRSSNSSNGAGMAAKAAPLPEAEEAMEPGAGSAQQFRKGPVALMLQQTRRPTSPPTPAASPAPMLARPLLGNTRYNGDKEAAVPDAQMADAGMFLRRYADGPLMEDEYAFDDLHMSSSQMASILGQFDEMTPDMRLKLLTALVDRCGIVQISQLAAYIAPKLKKDFLKELPVELGLRILSYVEDPRTLARASQVSRHWYTLLNDDLTWKRLCAKHRYRRLSVIANDETAKSAAHPLPGTSAKVVTDDAAPVNGPPSSGKVRRPMPASYKSHFRQRYLVEAAWRTGGHRTLQHITSDAATVVTSLFLTRNAIVVALDNSKIHVFSLDGKLQRTLEGHEFGVWAIYPVGNTLVSGGCDRDIRVWDLTTGECRHVMRGHTSTVRCIKMRDEYTAVTGSRDASLRVWDLRSGTCTRVLIGHSFSVRCLDVQGDICVSGSYDTTAKVWNITTGQCLATLEGHIGQIYDVVFDGTYICTGSLDTNIRVWNVQGTLLSVLQGHTSLVGQLQMRYPMLVSGGSDGWVRIWNLERGECVHRLAAHDNSVTSLQFDDNHIMSGGRDGRVTLWDTRTGAFIRELVRPPVDEVWRVAFQEEMAVVAASQGGKIDIEVISFAPNAEVQA